ncbi:succinylglutamate desuccinylase/aspartoacylase family protein [Halosegnis marinus]|uniref:Succinylglutamate desuccinylase/aspartoacylase family protein n=1 Tax=Halosegnis marinus TaxID=3034023 RepID=A0ABD5ZL20_9EURY|nr:succinylglutamate desuccinylase/aspartoacylase family protein [Halosegnis sp. DT85]
MELGTATTTPGERATGWLPVTEMPTGGTERLPVVLVDGAADGPTVWVTANVHGNEVVGLAVAQDLAAALDPADVSGRVVVVPTANPAGLRRKARRSYYGDEDPNRKLPDPHDEATEPPSVQELVGERLYEAFTETVPADYLLDLHTAGAGAIPFTIRDRVLYGAARTEDDARLLAGDVAALAEAVGLPVVTEYPPEEYTGKSLQRSVAGAALNGAGVPALTLELGEHRHVRPDHRAAGLAAVYRGLVHAGVLDAVPAEVAEADPGVEAPVEYPVRRFRGPRAERAGVVRHLVEPGAAFAEGDAVAEVRTVHGEVTETVTAERDGYVLGHAEGALAYENDPVCSAAVRDDGDLVAPREGEE